MSDTWPDAARETVEWVLAVHFSGDRMPHMSGDPRNRLSPGRRRAMEDARDAVLEALTPILAARVEAARRKGIEAAAREMECGCPDETKAAVLEALRDGHNSKKRWQACGHSQCNTIDAFNIRALLEPGQ